jgi:VanZ family protein
VSNAESESIADIIKPIVDSQNKISSETFNDIIRKAAHFTEFALLGTLIMLLRIALKKPPIFTMLFISLSTAVTDESIQIFNGRTDSVRDILLDFGGALTGIIISAGIYFIVLFIKKRVNNT